MSLDREKPTVTYNLTVHSSNSIKNTEISGYLWKLIRWKRVVAYWEEHNLNTDNSFFEILKFEDIICYIYRELQKWTSLKVIFRYIESVESSQYTEFLKYLFEKVIWNIDSMAWSATRFFSCSVIGDMEKHWFTDIIIEWLREDIDLQSMIARSKDKIGVLLMVISCIIHWIKIHGVYDENPLFWVFSFAKLFEDKVDEIIEKNPEAKVFTYNGWVHNMTIPIEWIHRIFWAEVDLKDLTFAPSLQEKLWEKFLSIDLVSQLWWRDESSHYNYLKNQNQWLDITIVEHSKWQYAIVFPISSYWTQYSQRIEDLMNPNL